MLITGPNNPISSASCTTLVPHCLVAIATTAAPPGISPCPFVVMLRVLLGSLFPVASSAHLIDCASPPPASRLSTISSSLSTSLPAVACITDSATWATPSLPLVVTKALFQVLGCVPAHYRRGPALSDHAFHDPCWYCNRASVLWHHCVSAHHQQFWPKYHISPSLLPSSPPSWLLRPARAIQHSPIHLFFFSRPSCVKHTG